MLSIISFLDDPVVNASNFCKSSAQIWKLLGVVINVFKIAIPVIIVLLALLDLGKAVMAGEEKEIKATQKLLIKRLVYGVLIFFVVTLVQMIFGMIGVNVNGNNGGAIKDSSVCWACATDPGSETCTNAIACASDPQSAACSKLNGGN